MPRITGLLEVFYKKESDDAVAYLPLLGMSFFLAFGTAWVGLQRFTNIDLLIWALLGQIACMSSIRGAGYSLIVLLVGALVKHAFFVENHFWQLGVEISLAMGFAMTAIVTESMKNAQRSLLAHGASKDQTIRNLEEELVAVRSAAQQEVAAWNDRLAAVQKEREEAASELACVQVLNDVVRKTCAQALQESEKIAEQISTLTREKTALEYEHSGSVSQQNRLQKRLNTLAEQLTQREGMLTLLQERLESIAGKESLYHELKKQFEEKNRILHQTRVELFQADTALQAASLEREQQPMDEPPLAEQRLLKDLVRLDGQCRALERENQELIELVQVLSMPQSPQEIIIELAAAAPVKRRRKTKAVQEEQAID